MLYVFEEYSLAIGQSVPDGEASNLHVAAVDQYNGAQASSVDDGVISGGAY